eukprot:10297455-Prorocentrum_lima.AAC.1
MPIADRSEMGALSAPAGAAPAEPYLRAAVVAGPGAPHTRRPMRGQRRQSKNPSRGPGGELPWD